MFEPPALPPAGWYPDLESPGAMRWWNGSVWAPTTMPPPAPDRLPEVGDLVGEAFRRVAARWRALLVIVLVTSLPAFLLQTYALHVLTRGLEIRGEEFLGWTSGRLGTVMPTLLGAIALTTFGWMAQPVLMLRDHDAAPGSGPEPTNASEAKAGLMAIRGAIGVLPRALGWSLLMVAVLLGMLLVLVLAFVVALPIGVLLVLAAVPLGFWAAIRLAFLNTAIVDRPGNPFRRSAEVSAERFWPVCGRLFVTGMIGTGMSIAASMLTAFTGPGGWSQTGSFRTDPRTGELLDVNLGELFEPTMLSVVLGSISALVSGVLVAGFANAALTRLYRTRNPA